MPGQNALTRLADFLWQALWPWIDGFICPHIRKEAAATLLMKIFLNMSIMRLKMSVYGMALYPTFKRNVRLLSFILQHSAQRAIDYLVLGNEWPFSLK